MSLTKTAARATVGAVAASVYLALVAWLALVAEGVAAGARVGLDTIPHITRPPAVPWGYHLLTALLTVSVLAVAVRRSRQARTWSYGARAAESASGRPVTAARRRSTADLWAAAAVLATTVAVGVATVEPLEPTGVFAGAERAVWLVYVQLAAQSPAVHVTLLALVALSLAPPVARARRPGETLSTAPAAHGPAVTHLP